MLIILDILCIKCISFELLLIEIPEVFVIPKITDEHKIIWLSSIYARYGYLIPLVQYNGPQILKFISEEVKIFLQNHDVKHMLRARCLYIVAEVYTVKRNRFFLIYENI